MAQASDSRLSPDGERILSRFHMKGEEEMTTINFERSGGITGKDLHLDLDFNTLPEDESHRMLKLIEDADFFSIPEHPAEPFTEGEFRYKINITAGQTSHTVHTSDSTMPKGLIPLVKELTMLKILPE